MSGTIEASRAAFATSIPLAPEAQVTTSTALVTTSRFEAPPELAPLPPGASTALVVSAAPKRHMFSWLVGPARSAPDHDPHAYDATVLNNQAQGLRNVLGQLHSVLANDAALLQRAPEHWEQLFTPYEVARASAIAVMAGLKVRLDAAAQAGAVAALSPSRTTYASALQAVKVADAECSSLMPIARTRHAEAKDLADRNAKAEAETLRVKQANREEIKDFTGTRRQSLVDRIRQLHTGGYGFCHSPAGMPGGNNDYGALVAEGVIPTMVLKGCLYFGKLSNSIIYWDANQPNPKIETLTELADIVDALMGRDPVTGEPEGPRERDS